jgi:serine protease inhibitor
MKKYFALPAVILFSLIILTCSEKPIVSPEPPDLTAAQKEVIKASNKFAFDIFKQVCSAEPDTNIFISPLSISYALGMTYNGAANDTKEAMGDVLGYGDLTDQEINESYKNLADVLTTIDPETLMEIANSIWYRQDFEVLQKFIDLNQEYFDALVMAMNFADPQSAVTINDWIAEKTHDRITDVIEPPIDPATVMFLINAIYFKGTWKYEFDKEDTEPHPFFLTDGTETTCDMMTQETEFMRNFNEDFKAVDLPYGDAGFSMTVFIPRPDKSLDGLISAMNENSWDSWMAGFSEDTITVDLPKFKIKYDRRLKEDLKELGMGIAFDPMLADFSGINPNSQLCIDDVIHSTFVQVDEKGTEAAAVTVVTVIESDNGEHYIIVDRPFVFVIHDNYTGAILFMGKITNPVWEE